MKLSKGEAVRDHCVPRRLAVAATFNTFLFGTNEKLPSPDSAKNQATICGSCHGKKGAAETALCAGDILTFWRILKLIHYPLQKAKAALAMYGFKTDCLEVAA